MIATGAIRFEMPGRHFVGVLFLPDVQPCTFENCIPQIRSFSIKAVDKSSLRDLHARIAKILAEVERAE
jgi:hypothetical protein